MTDPTPTPPPVIDSTVSKTPPRVWTVFVMFVLALGSIVLSGTLLVLTLLLVQNGFNIRLSKLESAAYSAAFSLPGLLGSILCSTVILVGASLIAAWLSSVPWRQRLRLRWVRMPVMMLLLGCLGVVAIGLVMQSLDGLGWLPKSELLEALANAVKGLPTPSLIMVSVAIGLLPGISEELFFRGYVQARLSERWGSVVAVVCTAIMFGVMHMNWVQGGFACLVGLYLGWMAERTGSVVPGMICHAVNNVFASLAAAANLETRDVAINSAMLLIGIVLVIGSWLYLHRRWPVRPVV